MKNKKTREKTVERQSSILILLSGLVSLFGDFFQKSVFAGLLGSEGRLEYLFRESLAGKFVLGKGKPTAFFKKILRFVASGFERSRFAVFTGKVYACFLNMRLQSIGLFLASYSLFALFALLILHFSGTEVGYMDFMSVIGLSAVSLPLIFSSNTLISGISKSRFIGSIFKDNLGVDMEMKERDIDGITFPKRLSGFSLVCGIALGTLSVFLSPLTFIFWILILSAFLFVMTSPEAGIVLTLAVIPFYTFSNIGRDMLFSLITVTTVSYVIKLIRGKRTLAFGLSDVAVLALLVIVFSSVFGKAGSYEKASVYAAFIYFCFLFTNLIRNRTWLGRSVSALIFSWVFIAFAGITVSLINNTSVIANGTMTDIGKSFVFGVSGKAIYLLLPAIPFLFSKVRNTKDGKAKFGYSVFMLLIFICIAAGGNSMPLIPLFVGLGVYFFSSLPIALFLAVPALLVGLVLRGVNIPTVSEMLGRSAEYADKVAFENRYARGGVIKALKDYFFTGIGMGDETFSKVYPNYSYAGFENASDSGSAILDLILGSGIIGCFFFFLVVLSFMRESSGYLMYEKSISKAERDNVSAALAGMVSLLFAACFDNIFETETVFLCFWIIIALGTSYVRMGRREKKRKEIRHPNKSDSADVEMNYVPVGKKI